MITSSRDGRPILIEIPELATYSPTKVREAGLHWPAIHRYQQILMRKPVTPGDFLRAKRHQAWLRCALATYFSTAPTEDVCAFWSQIARKLLQEAWHQSDGDQAHAALFALGKLGAGELNLSSDVDLLIVRADQTEFPARTLRRFQALLSESTEFGFCLRIDFDLRPGGRSAALVPSESEFENHYGYYGETWERLALVRLQPVCGNPELSTRLMEKAQRFSFRRHLDYALLEDLKLLRPRVHASFQPQSADEFNLKLGIGGIRDVELFIHAMQVVHGGKHAELRTPSTTQAAQALIDTQSFPRAEAQSLIDIYWFYRHIENHLQACDDQQTYVFSAADESTLRLDGTFAELQKYSMQVDHLVSHLLGRAERHEASLAPNLESQQQWLRSLTFSQNCIDNIWPQMIASTSLSRSQERDERARLRFLHAFVQALSRINLDKDLGLTLLRDFSRSVRAKATFFSLFLHEPKLIEDVAWLFSTSPYLGHLLASRPELLDSFIFRRQEATLSSDFDTFLEQLADRRLLGELIASGEFLARRNLGELLTALSFTADEVVGQLLDRLKREFPQSQLQIIALGKWGGEELGLRSDLDFIFVTPEAPNEDDHKVARRLISRLSESHKAGSIYNVDLRLRPSGRAGPLICSEDALKDYLLNQAEAWERQAYLRARPLSTAVQISPPQLSLSRGLKPDEKTELVRIHRELITERANEVDLKLNPGGFVEVEFAAQLALLESRTLRCKHTSTPAMLAALRDEHPTWEKLSAQLMDNYRQLRLIEQLQQLTSQQSGSIIRPTQESFVRLSQVYGTAPHDLYEQIQRLLHDNAQLLKSLDPLVGSR